MKKFTGTFNNNAGKALKNAGGRIFCKVDEDGMIYICSGYFVYRMRPDEYAATVQPFTKCEAGNWALENGEKREVGPEQFDVKKVLDDAVNAISSARVETLLSRCPLEWTDSKTKRSLAAFYNPAAAVACCYNSLYISAFDSSCTFHATSAKEPVIVMAESEVVGMVLPVKASPACTRAVVAWFTDPADVDEHRAESRRRTELMRAYDAQAAELRETIAAQAAELEKLRAELDALHNAEQATTVEQDKPAAPVDTKSAAELIAARFTELDGVKAIIKGAQSATPVVWLFGDTKKHAEAIRAAGARWSGKKGAYYIRVA